MNREKILEQACKCVCGDREQDYGSPENNFDNIANMWNTYLRPKLPAGVDLKLTGKDSAAMLALLKIVRISTDRAKEDNWIDLAGYAACGGEIEGNERTN